MGRMGKFTASDLTRLQNQLNKIQAGNAEAFVALILLSKTLGAIS